MVEGHKTGILKKIHKALERNKLGELLVYKGLISRQELRRALKNQKETSRPLGQIFIENAVISPWQLKMLLGRQAVLRSLATGLLLFASIGATTSHRAHADDFASGIQLVSASAEFGRVASYPNLLGTSEKKDQNISAFTKWTSMFARFDRQLKQAENVQVIRNWQKDIDKLKGRSMKDMVDGVNRLGNQTKYVLDNRNWGKSDYWATPVEFLTRGGDCEDYAIAKYAALRSLGFPEERLRVAIVQDTLKNIPHAVLVAYTDEGAFILDNQNKELVNAEVKGRYRPIFSINRQAWWLHQQSGNTIVASAE